MSFLEGVQKYARAVSAVPLPDDFTGCTRSLDWTAEATAESTQYFACIAGVIVKVQTHW